jgi:hypothetical protein
MTRRRENEKNKSDTWATWDDGTVICKQFNIVSGETCYLLRITLDCLQPKDKGRINPIVKPTRSTNVSNSFYFGMTLYMFRTVFPSIIMSSRLYIQQQAFVKQTLLSVYCSLASREKYLFDKCLLLYVKSRTHEDGRKDRPKHVECHSKIKWIWYICASTWIYYRNA